MFSVVLWQQLRGQKAVLRLPDGLSGGPRQAAAETAGAAGRMTTRLEVAGHSGCQLLRVLGDLVVQVDERGVLQPPVLLLDCSHDPGVAVPDADRDNACEGLRSAGGWRRDRGGGHGLRVLLDKCVPSRAAAARERGSRALSWTHEHAGVRQPGALGGVAAAERGQLARSALHGAALQPARGADGQAAPQGTGAGLTSR